MSHYVTTDMPKIQELPLRQPPRWMRKVMRSKRLTRWFLRDFSSRLQPIKQLQPFEGNEETVLAGSTAVGFSEPSVLVGDVSTVSNARAVEHDHPAVTLRVLCDVRVQSLSNLIYQGQSVFYDDMVQVETDRLPEELRRGVSLDATRGRLTQPTPRTAPHKMKSALSLLDATAPNYAHWLTEILPKAALWCQQDTRPQVPFLVDAGLHPNIMRSLALVINPGQEIVVVPRDQVLDVKFLHHISSPGHIPFEPRLQFQRSHGTFSSLALNAMVRAIKASIGLKDTDPQEGCVFIKRNSGVRNILNWRELDQLAADRGWLVVSPELMTFEEQVRVFHRAKTVIGATGAAMANLIFSRAGARLAVMMSTHPATPYFYWHNMAACRGVAVDYILCEPEVDERSGVHSNFSAPIEEMAAAF